MKITITSPPRKIKARFISADKLLSDDNALSYAIRMKEFIFGSDTVKAAEILGLNIFNIVFLKNNSFRELTEKKLAGVPSDKYEAVMLCFLLNCLYKGRCIRILQLYSNEDNIYIKEAQVLHLKIFDTDSDYSKKNKFLKKKAEKYSRQSFSPLEKTSRYIEAVNMAVVKHYAKRAVSEKEFIDKMNYRRFSTGLKINNRPASIDDINSVLNKRKNITLIDLTDTSSRLNLSALYAVIFKNICFEDIYSAEKVFSPDYDERVYNAAASEFINIVINGNGIEICDMLVKMAEFFGDIRLPRLESGKISSILKNYNEIYAIAAISYKFDKAFTEHEMVKTAMRHRMINRYWKIYCNILKYKKFGSVVSFCRDLAEMDIEKYCLSDEYADEFIKSYDSAQKAVKEIYSNNDV